MQKILSVIFTSAFSMYPLCVPWNLSCFVRNAKASQTKKKITVAIFIGTHINLGNTWWWWRWFRNVQYQYPYFFRRIKKHGYYFCAWATRDQKRDQKELLDDFLLRRASFRQEQKYILATIIATTLSQAIAIPTPCAPLIQNKTLKRTRNYSYVIWNGQHIKNDFI